MAALLFWALAFLLNDPRLADVVWLRHVVLAVLILIWLRNVAIEVLQCIGFVALGKLCLYFRSLENLGDALRITQSYGPCRGLLGL